MVFSSNSLKFRLASRNRINTSLPHSRELSSTAGTLVLGSETVVTAGTVDLALKVDFILRVLKSGKTIRFANPPEYRMCMAYPVLSLDRQLSKLGHVNMHVVLYSQS